MTRSRLHRFVLWLLLLFLFPHGLAAQTPTGVDVVITGEPRMVDGQVEAYVAVQQPGQPFLDLPADAFVVSEDGRPIAPDKLLVETAVTGLAVVIVVDRGGIAAVGGCNGPTGVARITEAKQLATDFVNNLSMGDGRPDDLVAVVGIGPKDAAGNLQFNPNENFSYNPADRNLALNVLEPLDAPENLLDPKATTPLYEGLYYALDLLTKNPNADIQAALLNRPKLILLFSDGIDDGYSNEAVESDILRLADQQDVIIHAARMSCTQTGNAAVVDTDRLGRLARQSNGQYWLHSTPETHNLAQAGMNALTAYANQYRLRFPSGLSSGPHQLRVQVTTPQGAAQASATFISQLQPPTLRVEGVAAGYSVVETELAGTMLPVTAVVEFPDAITRPMSVEFLLDGAPLAVVENAPYQYDWALAGLGVGSHTLTTRATDSQLGVVLTDERLLQVTTAPTPTPIPEPTPTPTPTPLISAPAIGDNDSFTNLLLWLVPALLVALVVLAFFLWCTNRKAQTAMSRVGQAMRTTKANFTRRLGPPKPMLGKLVVTRGPNPNVEYRIMEHLTKFGRESDVCDEVIPSNIVSKLHFSIIYNEAQHAFFIVDNGSTNGTFLNRQQIPPNQHVPLPFGSVIAVGNTGQIELLFQPIGSATQKLATLE
ncbi:MAG: FHA domain-containing protein [Anaerolinea sp.]|nr:FHA domain-containing protein [Anaerolinea sp.]